MRGDVPSFVSAMTGNLFVVSAPSGAGKSSLVSAVLAEDKRLALSVSFTTRGDVPSFVNAMTGNLFVVSAPSGAGKSSLVSAVLAEDKRLALSVSFTTRPPRSGEPTR